MFPGFLARASRHAAGESNPGASCSRPLTGHHLEQRNVVILACEQVLLGSLRLWQPCRGETSRPAHGAGGSSRIVRASGARDIRSGGCTTRARSTPREPSRGVLLDVDPPPQTSRTRARPGAPGLPSRSRNHGPRAPPEGAGASPGQAAGKGLESPDVSPEVALWYHPTAASPPRP